MKSLDVLILAASVAASTFASAQGSDPERRPRLVFRVIPVQGVFSAEHVVTPYRLYDRLLVTVRDPVTCGQRPRDPAVSIQGNTVFLSYALTDSSGGARSCTLVSEFEVQDAPNRDLEVSFAGGTEPYIVAKMKKCPGYKPSVDDIWECLVPSKD
jgi:hypothetical protein